MTSAVSTQNPTLHQPRSRPCVARVLLALLMVAVAAMGCGESEEAVVEPTKPVEAPPPVKVDPIPGVVDTFARSVHGQVMAELVEEMALKELRKTVKETKAERYDPFAYRSVLRRFYLEEGSRLRFFRGAQLSEVGLGTLENLRDARHHGLNVKNYHLRRIDKALGRLMALTMEAELDGDRIELSDADRKRAEALLRAGVVSPDDPDVTTRLLDALLTDERASRTLVEARNSARKRLSKQAALVSDIEADLADAFVHYAWDMHFRNPIWFELPGFDDKLADEQEDILLDNMRDKLAERIDEVDIPSYMRTLIPKNEQYWRLLPVLARYNEIVANGGWERLKKVELKPGRRHRAARALKKRLAVEGYYPPHGKPMPDEITDLVDDDLSAAIREYQRTHLLEETGETNRWFWHEIRRSAEEVRDLVEVTVDRWRETRIGHDPHYIWINVPDYHVEVWKDGERQLRFKVVVGNTDMGCDLNRKRWVRINATPLQSGEIDQIVVNPWWSIPDRIRREEILPEVRKNPDYFSDAGLQCLKYSGDECVKVRRAPGGKNPLGRVKFLFPNIHNTFLHDTPHEKFFTFPRRFFSHGCMRLEKPLTLAEYVLKADGQWDEDRFKRILERGHEYTYKLNKPFKLHVEYFSHRVDDDGTVFFLHDVYNHDRYRRRGKKFEPRRCTPDEVAAALRGDTGEP